MIGQTRPVETLIVQLWLYGVVIVVGVMAWRADTRRQREKADQERRFPPIDTRPMPPPPPIHFTRDPSPKPRRKEPAR